MMEKLAALDERYPEIIRLCARESAQGGAQALGAAGGGIGK